MMKLFLFFVLTISFMASFAIGSAPVEMEVFDAPSCEHCLKMRKRFFPRLASKYPPLQIRYFDLALPKNYQLLMKVEEKYGIEKEPLPENLPIVFVGKYVLEGEKGVKKDLEKKIREYQTIGCEAASSGIELVGEIQVGGEKVHLAYFYEPGCRECRIVEYMLSYFRRVYPNLETREFDIFKEENKELEEAAGLLLGVPEKERLLTPAIFIGEDYFIKKISHGEVEEALVNYSRIGTEPIWEKAESLREEARRRIVERFRKIGIPTVVLAGLIDGVNPCAFATIIFLIVYLAGLGKRRREMLWAGLFFSLGVFSTYFLLGMGLLAFIKGLGFLPILRKMIFLLGSGFCLVLGTYSLSDFFLVREKGIKEIRLKLPERLKRKIQMRIIKETRRKNFILASLGLGFSVSLLEAVCTGQVYLPTIAFVAGMKGLRLEAFYYLVLYNLFFILPLIAVFVLLYCGVSSAYLTKLIQKHLGKAKLLLTFVFLLLAFLLGYFAFWG